MVDTAIYVGMTGAKEAMKSIRVIANNLANANTIGFRADYETVKSVPMNQNKMQTRIFSASDRSYSDFNLGAIMETGGELDIAINGRGFIAVQTKEGKEAYTRAGNLRLTKEGLVTTSKGDFVLGSTGLLIIPPAKKISIGEGGTVSAQLRGQSENQIANLGNIKLVDIPNNQLRKGEDGLFHLIDEGPAVPASASVKVLAGALEGSNVDPVRALTELIDISRQFEMHTKLMKSIEDNSTRSNQLLNVTE